MTTFEGVAQMTTPTLPPRYPGVAYALARYRARRIVERELRSQGLRVQYIPHRDIIAQAMEYLRNHRELLDQCAETVRNGPELRTLAEREERERWRKWKRGDEAPMTVNRTLPRRLPNAEYRQREYLTESEVDRLIEAARKRRRNGQGMLLRSYWRIGMG